MTNRLWLRDAGFAVIITPTILFFLPIYGAIQEPRLLGEHWDFYLPFIALPWTAGIALFWSARRLRPTL